MSIKSQEGHMRQLALLLTTDLGCIFDERESGPNGSKKAFLNVGKVFLRALAKDLGLHEVTVSANSGGIAVSGTCSLYGMWEDRGIAVWIEQRLCADGKVLCYRVLQSVCGIQRGSQPYSHMKKAELVLKGYVSESSSTQLTSLNIAINGGLAMGHYWKGRLLLEQAKQDHDRCNDYKDAAIASFCATNVTERFDHLPENADEDAAPQLSPPQWLSAIELLRYPDRAVFRVDRRMVFQTIYQKLTQQVEEVQSDNIQIHNERYRLTKKDVRSNLERCLDMVKAQFPDKEPLIQKMIRSIR